MDSSKSKSGRSLVWLLFIAMFLAHQDFWWWDDSSLALFSIGCALLGWLVIIKAWPTELEAFADEKEETDLSEN
jgi:hypothetical protein